MKLYVVRHDKIDLNDKKVFNGRYDDELSNVISNIFNVNMINLKHKHNKSWEKSNEKIQYINIIK